MGYTYLLNIIEFSLMPNTCQHNTQGFCKVCLHQVVLLAQVITIIACFSFSFKTRSSHTAYHFTVLHIPGTLVSGLQRNETQKFVNL